jgi:Terpene synthase family 2, C-terminal metal binding
MPTATKRDRETPSPGSPGLGTIEASLKKLDSPFLASRDAAFRAHVFDLARRVATRLDDWASRYPAIRRVRVLPLALSVSAAAPFADVDALVSTARVSLWVFTLDDLCDEEAFAPAELACQLDAFRRIAGGGTADPGADRLAAALGEVRDDLARYPLFARLSDDWARALIGTIDGMVQENAWRDAYRRGGTESLPTYAEYVATGRYSIGGPPHIWSALVTGEDRTTPAHRAYLGRMERLSSICVRLANDLRSHAKELREGKINGLIVAARAFERDGASPSASWPRAEALVRADIALALSKITELQAHGPTATGQPEAAIADIARFVSEFYARHDYHTFATLGETVAVVQ